MKKANETGGLNFQEPAFAGWDHCLPGCCLSSQGQFPYLVNHVSDFELLFFRVGTILRKILH
jgi:hypothetical protein